MRCTPASHDEQEVGLGMCGDHLSLLTETAKPKHDVECGVCRETIEAYEDARVAAPCSWMDEGWVHSDCTTADPLQGPVEPPEPELEPVDANSADIEWKPVMDWTLSCFECGKPGSEHGRLAFKKALEDGEKERKFVFLECLADDERERISDAYGVMLRSDSDPRGGWRVWRSPEDRTCVICGTEIPGGQEALLKRDVGVTWACGNCT